MTIRLLSVVCLISFLAKFHRFHGSLTLFVHIKFNYTIIVDFAALMDFTQFFLLPLSSFNFAFSILHFMVYYHITIIARELYFRISSACFFHFRILQTRFVPHFSNFFATLKFLNRQINTVKLCFSGNAHKIQKEKQNLWKIKNHLVKTSHVKANEHKKSDKISSYYRKLCKSLLIEFLPLTEPCGTFCFHCIKFVRDV